MADISKITLLDGTTYDLKDATARSSIPAAADTTPSMDGTEAVGSSSKYAREDHVHPRDTTLLSKSGGTMSGPLTLSSDKFYEPNSAYGLNVNNSDVINVNGIYMNDTADSGLEGINFYRDTTHWDSLFAKNGKLFFTPYRQNNSAAGEYSNYEVYARPYYQTGTTDIAMRSMVALSRANRFAFLPADQIIIEQTTDGGETWTNAGYSDDQKKALFATRGAIIKIPLLNNAKSTLCGVRVTFTAMKYNVPSETTETNKYSYWNSSYVTAAERYSNLREMWFWLSSNNDSIRVQLYRANGGNASIWYTTFDTDFGMTGWSGSDWIRWDGNYTFGGSITQTGNFWNWRVVFWSRIPDGKTEFQSATQQSISGICGYGDSVWVAPNPLMKEDHLYTWDVDRNATFPAKVTATSFAGNLIGNITGNSTGVSTSGNATNSVARHVWFSDSTTETKRAYSNSFMYTPSTNMISANISGSAAMVNGHTVNSDVPANAVFTDTTYESKTAASGGTDVSLVTTGEKAAWNGKVNISQGTSNAGKFLVVGSDGNVTTVTMSAWQGGSY